MGRMGDTGDYEIGNCRFITCKQNQEEKKLNGGSTRGGIGTSIGLTGRKRPEHTLVLTGRRKETHEGVRITREKKSKNFKVTSPVGEVFYEKYLIEFCEKHNLHYSSMTSVCRGNHSHHKGWTGEYLESESI